jgi:uncharacterized protein YggU (UPF0235/DUF167 family)
MGRITVRVTPRSRVNQLRLDRAAALCHIHLTAPPVDDAANKALIALLAERIGLPQRAIHIVHGAHSRQKIVEIAGVDTVELLSLLHSRQ